MGLDFFVSAGAQWLWEKHGKSLVSKALGKVRERWSMFRWQDAETKYRALLKEQHSTTRLLGNPRKIFIEGIFTDVFVLDKLTAMQRFNFEQLRGIPIQHELLPIPSKRRPVLKLAINEKRLFILGKPGAGKTTLLKYITLQACAGKIKKTPVFISMKDWGDSNLELLPFLALQFKICAFPDTEAFIEQLLIQGNILILFDGIDEVNLNRRAEFIQAINKASKLYRDIQIIVTCRIAATDYMFDQFTYLEIADFDERQMYSFLNKWYQSEPSKLRAFLVEFEKPEKKRLRELAKTPLLLALLCLVFDESLSFPLRKADLYRESLDTLLKRWDTTRGIQRDDIYHSLTLTQKEQMLAYIAKQNFLEGNYFVRTDMLSRQIEVFLEKFLNLNSFPQDGDTVLRAIEAQHGILVERAHGIYSFSHLTFQEYFAARYFASYLDQTTLNMMVNHMMDDSWREIILLTSSLLNDADPFLDAFMKRTIAEGKTNSQCAKLIKWAGKEASYCKNSGPATKIYLLFNVFLRSLRKLLISSSDFPGTRTLNKKIAFYLDICCGISLASSYYLTYHTDIDVQTTKTNASKIMSQLSKDLGIRDIDFPIWDPYITDVEQMEKYLASNELIIECMKQSNMQRQSMIESNLLVLDS